MNIIKNFLFFAVSLLFSCSILFSKSEADVWSRTQVLEYVKNCIPENPVIVEAGAYKGNESIAFTKVWPEGHIHSFEPVPDHFAILKKRTADYPTVNIYSDALSDQIGHSEFYVSSHVGDPNMGDESSSLLKPKGHLREFRDIVFRKKIKVNTTTLDAWAEREGVDHVDFIWLDLQGMEYQALSASPTILKTVKAVFTEINYSELYEGCILYPVFKKWFEQNGFKEVYRHAYWGCFGDALFVKADLL